MSRLLQIVKSSDAKGNYLDALVVFERSAQRELRKKLATNVSAAIAVALGEAGVPSKAVRGIVLTARCAGLAGHLLEESERPLAATLHAAIAKLIRYEP